MESNKIEALLTAYFEGNTSLAQEEVLLDYFNNHKVADHLVQYKPIFVGMLAARKVSSSRSFKLEDSKAPKIIKTWWYAIAAMAVIAFGIGNFYLSQPQMSKEEKEALAAFENSKKAMLMLSENLNKGTQQLSYIGQFNIAKDEFEK